MAQLTACIARHPQTRLHFPSIRPGGAYSTRAGASALYFPGRPAHQRAAPGVPLSVCQLRHITLPEIELLCRRFLPRQGPVANGGFLFEKPPGEGLSGADKLASIRCRIERRASGY